MARNGTEPWPHPAYRIETERLVLRCYQPDDAEELTRAITDNQEHLVVWMPWAEKPQPVNESVELIRKFRARFDLSDDFIYGVYDPATGRQVGGAGLHARVGPHALEIGYWIAADRLRQGFATEIGAALTRVAFDVLGVRRLHIHCAPENVASAGIPRKLGYLREGVLRWRELQPDGSMRDTLVHTMTADDYPQSPAATAAIRAYDAVGRSLLH